MYPAFRPVSAEDDRRATELAGIASTPQSRMQRAFRGALFCGVAPLLTGIFIFCLWLATRWPFLLIAGMLTIAIGMVLFLVGVFCVWRFQHIVGAEQRVSANYHRLAPWILLALLLTNFPVAFGLTVTAFVFQTRYTVTVRNHSAQALTNVQLSGGGCSELLGTIQPGAVARSNFWFEQDGSLTLLAAHNGIEHESTVEGYVTSNLGGRATVTVEKDGTISVQHWKN